MKRSLFLLCSLFLFLHSNAQYNLKQNNVWAFGNYAGLNFNSGSPVPITTSISTTGNFIMSAASVCDTGGHLLFYSSGDTVWNRNNQVMPNGGGLMALYPDQAASTAQGSLIVPVLNNPHQYYLFSLQQGSFAQQDIFAGRLYYCIVDMTLNGGLGDVVAGQKGILLDSVLAEKMIAVPGDNCDIWVLVHDGVNNNFKAYEITNAGINPTPIISSIGNLVGDIGINDGPMEVSLDRRKLVSCTTTYFGASGTELFDFDPTTGILSNVIELDSFLSTGVAFSPDDSKLYCEGNSSVTNLGYLYQYDLSLTGTTAIINSRTMLDSGTNVGAADHIYQNSDLRLGPDGKIYLGSGTWFANPGNATLDSLGQINSPNLAGIACNYVFDAIPLDTGSFGYDGYLGLGNIYMLPLQDTVHTTTDTTLALTDSLVLQMPSGYFNYFWNDGTTDSGKVIHSTGTYYVTYTNYCTYRTDSFVVRPAAAVPNINTQATATLTVYPSPAQTTVTITINGTNKVKGTLLLIDAVGRTVSEQVCTNSQQIIDVSKMAAGVYTVSYIDNTSQTRLQQQIVITR